MAKKLKSNISRTYGLEVFHKFFLENVFWCKTTLEKRSHCLCLVNVSKAPCFWKSSMTGAGSLPGYDCRLQKLADRPACCATAGSGYFLKTIKLHMRSRNHRPV